MSEKLKDKEVVNQVTKEVKKLDASLSEYKKQALINVMFLYGKHHFDLQRSRSSNADLEQKIIWEIEALRKNNTTRRTSNYILPLFRSLHSRLIRMKANIHVEPTTSTDKDRDAARVSKEVAEDFWQNCNQNNPWINADLVGMQAVCAKLALYMLSLGAGNLIPYFNPKAEAFIYDKEKEEIFAGEVGQAEIRVANPLNIFKDMFGRYFIERRFLCPEQVWYETGKEVAPIAKDEDTVEAQISRLLEGKEDEDTKDGVYVYTKYCTITKEYPKGRLIICTDKDLLFDEELPAEYKKRIPFYECKYQDLGFTKRGQGAIEQVIDLQQDYNETLSRISGYKRLLSGKVMVPRGSKMAVKWDDEVGQIIHFNPGMKPTYEAGASVPGYLVQELNRIRRDMEDSMNAHDTSMGRPASGVTSGVAIDNLSENDYSMISPELTQLEGKLSKTTECVLDIAQMKYTENRLLQTAGEDLAFEIKSFEGSALFGHKKIQVKLGSSLPSSASERRAYILNMKHEGLISPERAKELLEFSNIEGAYKSLDETAAKHDILNMIAGKMEVIAEPWEDHTIHLKVINDFRKGSKYMKLDEEIRMRINALAEQHQQYLLNEQAAAQNMGGALPAPAEPQQQ